MPRGILIDEILLTLVMPGDLAKSRQRSIRRTLSGSRFKSHLRATLRDLLGKHPSLKRVRCVISP